MLTIIHGEDSLRSRIHLRGLVGSIPADRFDVADTEWPRVRSLAEGNSLFEGERVLIVEGALSDAEFGASLATWKKLPLVAGSRQVHLIFFEGADVGKRSAFKKVAPHAHVEHFSILPRAKAVEWLLGEFASSKNISKPVIEHVLDACGGDMWHAYNELGKVAAFCGNQAARAEDAEYLHAGSSQEQIFSTIDALFARRGNEAMARIQGHWAQGESPLALFAMIERQLRIIALVRSCLDEGETSSRAIAAKLRLHPFVVQKTLPLARNWTLPKTKELYARVESLDEKAKRGEIDPYLACELLASAVLA